MKGLLKNSWVKAGVFVTVCAALVVYAHPPVALVVGIAFAFCFGTPFENHGKFTKRLLQACVVCLGFSMDFQKILNVGVHGAFYTALTIMTTLLLGFWIGRKMQIHPNTSALISAGTAICGGSAIAAVGTVITVTEAQIALSLGTIFLLNAAALYIFPVLGHALHLSQEQFGMWAGVAIQDVSSVVGAAFSYGPKALETATAVKLSRTLWIIPLVFTLAIYRGHSSTLKAESGNHKKIKFELPWFILFFLLASVARSFIPAVAQHSVQIASVVRGGMIVVLCLIGTSLTYETLRSVGWKASVQGILLWLFISVASLVVILWK